MLTTCELARRAATAYLPGTAIHDTRAEHVAPNPQPAPLPQVSPTDAHRLCMPDASRITMSLNTVSVSTMPFITPVISSSTNPCIADQNSSAA